MSKKSADLSSSSSSITPTAMPASARKTSMPAGGDLADGDAKDAKKAGTTQDLMSAGKKKSADKAIYLARLAVAAKAKHLAAPKADAKKADARKSDARNGKGDLLELDRVEAEKYQRYRFIFDPCRSDRLFEFYQSLFTEVFGAQAEAIFTALQAEYPDGIEITLNTKDAKPGPRYESIGRSGLDSIMGAALHMIADHKESTAKENVLNTQLAKQQLQRKYDEFVARIYTAAEITPKDVTKIIKEFHKFACVQVTLVRKNFAESVEKEDFEQTYKDMHVYEQSTPPEDKATPYDRTFRRDLLAINENIDPEDAHRFFFTHMDRHTVFTQVQIDSEQAFPGFNQSPYATARPIPPAFRDEERYSYPSSPAITSHGYDFRRLANSAAVLCGTFSLASPTADAKMVEVFATDRHGSMTPVQLFKASPKPTRTDLMYCTFLALEQHEQQLRTRMIETIFLALDIDKTLSPQNFKDLCRGLSYEINILLHQERMQTGRDAKVIANEQIIHQACEAYYGKYRIAPNSKIEAILMQHKDTLVHIQTTRIHLITGSGAGSSDEDQDKQFEAERLSSLASWRNGKFGHLYLDLGINLAAQYHVDVDKSLEQTVYIALIELYRIINPEMVIPHNYNIKLQALIVSVKALLAAQEQKASKAIIEKLEAQVMANDAAFLTTITMIDLAKNAGYDNFAKEKNKYGAANNPFHLFLWICWLNEENGGIRSKPRFLSEEYLGVMQALILFLACSLNQIASIGCKSADDRITLPMAIFLLLCEDYARNNNLQITAEYLQNLPVRAAAKFHIDPGIEQATYDHCLTPKVKDDVFHGVVGLEAYQTLGNTSAHYRAKKDEAARFSGTDKLYSAQRAELLSPASARRVSAAAESEARESEARAEAEAAKTDFADPDMAPAVPDSDPTPPVATPALRLSASAQNPVDNKSNPIMLLAQYARILQAASEQPDGEQLRSKFRKLFYRMALPLLNDSDVQQAQAIIEIVKTTDFLHMADGKSSKSEKYPTGALGDYGRSQKPGSSKYGTTHATALFYQLCYVKHSPHFNTELIFLLTNPKTITDLKTTEAVKTAFIDHFTDKVKGCNNFGIPLSTTVATTQLTKLLTSSAVAEYLTKDAKVAAPISAPGSGSSFGLMPAPSKAAPSPFQQKLAELQIAAFMHNQDFETSVDGYLVKNGEDQRKAFYPVILAAYREAKTVDDIIKIREVLVNHQFMYDGFDATYSLTKKSSNGSVINLAINEIMYHFECLLIVSARSILSRAHGSREWEKAAALGELRKNNPWLTQPPQQKGVLAPVDKMTAVAAYATIEECLSKYGYKKPTSFSLF